MKTCLAAMVSLAILAFPDERPEKRWRAAFDAGVAAAEEGDYEKADASFAEALKIAEQSPAADLRLADTLTKVAETCTKAETCDGEQALRSHRRALEIRKRVKGPNDPIVADSFMSIGHAEETLGNYGEAVRQFREALAIREKKFGSNSKEAAETYVATAWAYQYDKDPAQALRSFELALELRQKDGAGKTAEFADLLDAMARLRSAQGSYGKSTETYDRAIAVRSGLWKESDPRFVGALRGIARSCQYWKHNGFAEDIFRRILRIEESAHGARSEQSYEALKDLGNFANIKLRYVEAEGYYTRALAVREALGRHDLDMADCIDSIVRLRDRRHRYLEAIEPAKKSLAIRRRLLKSSEWRVLGSERQLAELYVKADDPVSAEQVFQAFAEHTRLEAPVNLAYAAESLGKLYLERRHYQLAVEKLETAVATYEASVKREDEMFVRMLMELSQAYQAVGRQEDANRVAWRAIGIQWKLVTPALSEAFGKMDARLWGILAVFAAGGFGLLLLTNYIV